MSFSSSSETSAYPSASFFPIIEKLKYSVIIVSLKQITIEALSNYTQAQSN